eukprot:g8275.t1
MDVRRSKDGWISSLEAVVRDNPGAEVDQARMTATHFAAIFEERRKKELLRSGGKGRELPRFFVPPPVSTVHSDSTDDATKLEESRVAEARSKLRAKARSRFLQRREDALMGFEDLSEVEQALATCVPPPPPPPGADAAVAAAAAATTSLLETTRGGLDDGRKTATATAASAPGGGGGGSGGGDASREGSAAANSATPPNPFTATDAQGGSADYMDFVRLRGMVSGKAAACFKPRTFLRFPRDIRARIPSRVFFKHVYESVTLQKTRLTLHFYDSEGLGFLREQDLENYVYDHIPTMPALRAIHDNFYPFYVFTAVRRFMFFLDPKRTGKISIDTLVRSRVMEELLQLRMAPGPGGSEAPPASGSNPSGQNPHGGPPPAAGPAASAGEGGGSEDQKSHTNGAETSSSGGGGVVGESVAERNQQSGASERGDGGSQERGGGGGSGSDNGGGSGSGELPSQDLSKNWFSAENTLRVYGEYLELDEDQNGMLSKRELMNFAAAGVAASFCPASPPRAAAVSPTPTSPGRSPSPPPALPTSQSPPSSPSAAAAAATRPCSLACPVPRTSAASRSSLLALSSTSGGVRTPSPTRPSSPGAGGGAAAAAVAAMASSPPRSPGGGVVGVSTPPHGSGAAAVSGGDTERRVSDEGEVGGTDDGDGTGRKAAAGTAGEAQMDYKTFLDLVLAMDNKQTRQAMQYFWRVLDVHGEGRLTVATISLFFRDVRRVLKEGGFETPDAEDVKDEIFDMVKPADPAFITLADLLLSSAGHTVVSMLVDVNGFWTYDNRESLATWMLGGGALSDGRAAVTARFLPMEWFGESDGVSKLSWRHVERMRLCCQRILDGNSAPGEVGLAIDAVVGKYA